MKALRELLFVGIAVIMFLFAGCATTITPGAKIDTESFSKIKKIAIVTIAGTKEIKAKKGVFQSFKDVPEQNTQPVIDKLRPEVINAFQKSKHLKVESEKRVLKAAAYRHLKADEPVQKVAVWTLDFNTAQGYKFIRDPEKLSKLAKDLNVDAVVAVRMNFWVNSGVAGGFGIGVKRFKVVTGLYAVAYDKNGKEVWTDSVHESSELADSQFVFIADVRNVDFEKLKPHAFNSAKEALGVLVGRLDDGLDGKHVGPHVASVMP